MNIIVRKDKMLPDDSVLVGGEYAISTLEIYVDSALDKRTQVDRVIHSIIEGYCPNWPHDKVDELNELIIEGLDLLDEMERKTA
jgi:hypothetical protein